MEEDAPAVQMVIEEQEENEEDKDAAGHSMDNKEGEEEK